MSVSRIRHPCAHAEGYKAVLFVTHTWFDN
jgi:hypothetical protein